MTSVVSICNLALANVGQRPIDKIDEPSTEARLCQRFYEISRDTLLSVYPWRFATTTLALAQIDNDRPGAWGAAYKRQRDCLRVLWIGPQYDAASTSRRATTLLQDRVSWPSEQAGETIYCDANPAICIYVRKVEDPNEFPPLFVTALAWELASAIAYPITRDVKSKQDAYQLANAMRLRAEAADASEAPGDSSYESEFVRARE